MKYKVFRRCCNKKLHWRRHTERPAQIVLRRRTGRILEVSIDIDELYSAEQLHPLELGHSRGIIENSRRIVSLRSKRVALRTGGAALKRIAKAIGMGCGWLRYAEQGHHRH